MSLFLAAALGNVLALCIHAATWWLRQWAIILMVCAGWFFAFAYFAALGCTFLWLIYWPYRNEAVNTFLILGFLAALFLIPFGFGAWHYRIFKDEWEDIHEPVFSFYTEFGVSVLLCGLVIMLFYNFVPSTQQRQNELSSFGLDVIFALSYFVTSLAGAVFRKQFVSAWQYAHESLQIKHFN